MKFSKSYWFKDKNKKLSTTKFILISRTRHALKLFATLFTMGGATDEKTTLTKSTGNSSGYGTVTDTRPKERYL